MSHETGRLESLKNTDAIQEELGLSHPELNLLGQSMKQTAEPAKEAGWQEYPRERMELEPSITEEITSISTDNPVPRTPAKWHQQHDGLAQKARTTNVPLVFFGDSITEGMSEGDALKKAFDGKAENFGIVGDSTQHLLWRLQNGEADFKNPPKEAVLLIGANNIGAANSDDIVKGILANVKELSTKLPDTKLLVLGVLPQGKTTADHRRNEIIGLNKELAQQLSGKANVTFFDVGPLMLEKDGSMSPKVWWGDGLHPRDYTPMFNAIKPVLAKMEDTTKK